jgi:hypothetical protein
MDGKEPKFGTRFKIDHRNWLDSPNPDREGVLTEKPYVKVIYEIRSRLEQNLNEIPPCPDNIKTLGDLFAEGEKVVNARWLECVSGLFDQYRNEWLAQIPDTKEYEELRALLSNKSAFEQSLRTYTLFGLEQLKSSSPDGWYKLILASSERQLALNRLCDYWVKNSENLPEKIGMPTDEIKLIMEIGKSLTKYFNIAFVKQVELANTPGGSTVTPLNNQPGASRVYDIYKNNGSDDFEIKTFGEMFKYEMERIVLHLNRLAEKTEKLIIENKIPGSYKNLPSHLKLLAKACGSEEKNLGKLTRIWDEVDKSCKELAESGCPISIIGQSIPMVSGDANKVDIELRVGLRDKKARAFEKTMKAFHESAQNIADTKIKALSGRFIIPPPQVTRQIYFLGTNLIWETPADSRAESINIHYNTLEKGAKIIKPIFDKLFPENPLADDEYNNALVSDVGLHELGHGVLSVRDNNVLARVGTSTETAILEELKAETVSSVILKNRLAKGEEINVRTQALIKIADIISFLSTMSPEKGSVGERYYYAAIAMLKKLIDNNVLQKTDVGYKISDPDRVIETIADLGEEILSKFYENSDSKPEDVQKFGQELRETKHDPKVSEFLEALQNALG